MKHLFLFGAAGYPVLELIFRGRTHYSMALAGGASAVMIGKISKLHVPFLVKPALCMTAITGIEALCGMIWNRKYQVWDYRHLPLNWRGQVCLPFSLLWYVLSAGMLCILPDRNT